MDRNARVNWRELDVVNEGESIGLLGEVIDRADNSLRYADLMGDGTPEWTQHFLAAPDEDPDWDTPRVPVDWTGFAEAFRAAIARAEGGA